MIVAEHPFGTTQASSMMKKTRIAGIALIFATGIAAGLFFAGNSPFSLFPDLQAQEAAPEAGDPADFVEPSKTKARARETYYPNSEDLGPDEMRVIACGSGAAERISSLQIPYNCLDKEFNYPDPTK